MTMIRWSGVVMTQGKGRFKSRILKEAEGEPAPRWEVASDTDAGNSSIEIGSQRIGWLLGENTMGGACEGVVWLLQSFQQSRKH